MASLLLGVGVGVGAPSIRPQSVSITTSRLSFSQSESLAPTSLPSVAHSLSLSAIASPPSLHSVYCGRGDKKTERGKRFNHSFGNCRPRNKKKGRGPPRVPTPPGPPRKDKFDTDEKIKVDIDESLFSN